MEKNCASICMILLLVSMKFCIFKGESSDVSLMVKIVFLKAYSHQIEVLDIS